MARPVTLFTGQWADLPLTELAPLVKQMGFDGLELACWGVHFDVKQTTAFERVLPGAPEDAHGSWPHGFRRLHHLVGQGVCDPIDERHQAILSPEVWRDVFFGTMGKIQQKTRGYCSA
jgi:hypothetical protein